MSGLERHDDGGRIYLRRLTEADVTDAYVAWFRDSVVTEFLDSKNITREDAANLIRHGWDSGQWHMYGIIHREDDRHIGNLKIGPIHRSHKISDLVTVIGNREYWGKGIATEAIRLGSRVAFEVYGLRKLSAGIVEGNVGSVKCYTRAGWVVEGVLKAQYLVNGEPRDRICIACFNPRDFSAP